MAEIERPSKTADISQVTDSGKETKDMNDEQGRELAAFLTNFKASRKVREQVRNDARGVSKGKVPNVILGHVDRRGYSQQVSPDQAPLDSESSDGQEIKPTISR